MVSIFKTKILIYQSKANLDVNVSYLSSYRPRNFENAGMGFVSEPRFHIPFFSMILFAIEITFISETDYVIELEFQRRTNHGY